MGQPGLGPSIEMGQTLAQHRPIFLGTYPLLILISKNISFELYMFLGIKKEGKIRMALNVKTH